MTVKLEGSSSGHVNLASKATGANNTLTLPDTASGELVAADSSGHINLADNKEIKLGTGGDLQIYHDGSNSYIKDSGTGNLVIATSELSINNAASNEEMIKATQNGAVELFYDNSKKCETGTSGITVSGYVVATGDNGYAYICNDSLKSSWGTGFDLNAYHDGSHSYLDHSGTGHFHIRGNGSDQIKIQAKNGEQSILVSPDSSVVLYYDNGKRFETTNQGVTISWDTINDPGLLKLQSSGGSSNQTFLQCFYNTSSAAGGLRRNGTSAQVELFNGSDRRIKKDIAPMPAALSKLNQIELKTYKYKDDETASGTGPIAQDLISIFPDKVVKTDDGTGTDLPSDVEPWSIGTDFTWHLIKAVQELSAEVETLKTKVATLEGS